MKQLMYVKAGVLEWHDHPQAQLQAATDVLVRPLVVARCDLDCNYLFANIYAQIKFGSAKNMVDPTVPHYMGDTPFKGPFPFGHECIAEVIECGSAVNRLRGGDRVIVPFQVSCGTCSRCRGRLTASCETLPPMSLFGFGSVGGDWGGAMCDVMRIPFADHLAVPLPGSLDVLGLASASDNLPVAWQAVAPLLRQRPGAPVLVIGGGARSIALYAVGFARAMGASEVDYMDTNADGDARGRFEIAQALGARCIEAAPSGEPQRLYPCSVDASSNRESFLFAVRSLESDGMCSSPSMYFEKDTPMPLFQLYARRTTLKMGYGNARYDIEEMLKVLQAGAFQPGLVTTLVAPWEDAHKAFLEPTTKVVVHRL